MGWLWFAIRLGHAEPFDPLDFEALTPDWTTTEAVVIDTDTAQLTMGNQVFIGAEGLSGSRSVIVFTFGEVTIDHDVHVVGLYPVAILSHGDLQLTATLDAAAVSRVAGPGGYPGATCGEGNGDGEGPGGGFGADGASSNGAGGGGGFGGAGGSADSSAPGALGGPAYADLLTETDGGSGGGGHPASGDPCPNPSGGGGGGAVQLVARGRLTLTGRIDVSGAAGADYTGAISGGGGGGGAGGGIVLVSGVPGSCNGDLEAPGGDGGTGQGTLYTDGGGGGGGAILLAGIVDEGCTLVVSGGVGPLSGANAGEPGFAGTVIVDPDLDGDGVTILGGDCDDWDSSVYAAGEDGDCDDDDDEALSPPGIRVLASPEEVSGCACSGRGAVGNMAGWLVLISLFATGRRRRDTGRSQRVPSVE